MPPVALNTFKELQSILVSEPVMAYRSSQNRCLFRRLRQAGMIQSHPRATGPTSSSRLHQPEIADPREELQPIPVGGGPLRLHHVHSTLVIAVIALVFVLLFTGFGLYLCLRLISGVAPEF